MRWMVACVVLMVCQVAWAADGFKFAAGYGPYDVGFKVVQQYDHSRSYRAGVDAVTGEADRASQGRPIQTLIWYPAASPGRKLVYSDYIHVSGSEDRFDLARLESQRIAEEAIREYLSRGYRPADIARVMSETVHATGDAPATNGKFPLVVYAPSDASSAFENEDLCEYLASHGYVVIASPSHGAHVRYMTDGNIPDNMENTRAQAADIGFLIGYAASLPDVDLTKVGVVAYSWGGMSSTFAAATDSRIRALVDMDGSVRYFPKVLASAPDVTPDRIQVPLLFFADREDPLALGKDSQPNSFVARIHHADVTEIGLRKLTHEDLSSDSLRLPSTFDPLNTTFDERNESYAWIARYTRQFLDDVLKGDAAARAFMAATPEANHVPPGTLSIQHRPSVGPNASVASLAQALASNGFDRSVETYAAYTREHPGFHVNENTFEAWFSSLSDLARSNEAIGLCRLWVHVYPKSVGAWMDLAEAFEFADQPQAAVESYQQALKLDPHNSIIVGAIKFLKSTMAR
jgi:dienelactone hydrolase